MKIIRISLGKVTRISEVLVESILHVLCLLSAHAMTYMS